MAGAVGSKRPNFCAFSAQRIAPTAVSQRDRLLGVNQDTHGAKDDWETGSVIAGNFTASFDAKVDAYRRRS
jgi:hypothetical protein